MEASVMKRRSSRLSEEQYVACERCNLFALCRPVRIGDADIDVLGDALSRRTPIRRGEFLFHAGDPCTAVYALCAGSVKLTLGEGDEERIVGFQLPGELVGADAIHTRTHSVHAEVLEEASFCEIPVAALDELGEGLLQFQRGIIELMSQQLAEDQRIMMYFMGRKSAAERLAAFLLSFSARLRAHGFPHLEFTLSMSREEIGNYLGLVKETVSRLFVRFRREGLITVRGRRVRLDDPEGLRQVAGELGID